MKLSPRAISNSYLNASQHLQLYPINLLTLEGTYFLRMGSLILRQASRLDAFSVYPFHGQLLSYAFGETTDIPLPCPSRSSRTKDRSVQTSYAHDR